MDSSRRAAAAEVVLRGGAHELRALLNEAPLGILHLDADGRVFWANSAQLDLLGYACDECVGRSLAELCADECAGQEALQALQRGDALREREVALRHKDGSLRHVLISSAPRRHAARFVNTCCFVQDVTDHRRVERRLAAENAVVRALAEATSLAEAAPKVLEAVCRTTGWSWAALWGVEGDLDERVLRCATFWGRADRPAPAFEALTRGLTFHRGVGLPGGVWASGQPAWLHDFAAHSELPRCAVAAGDGVHAGLAFPVLARDGSVLGVMEFFSRHPREADPDLLDMMQAIGRQVGQYVERRGGERALAASEACNATIVRASLDCIISIDHRGRVLEWNPATEHTFGYTRDEAVGREMAELIVPPRLRDQHRLALARHLLTGQGEMLGRRVETWAMRKGGGGEFPVELAIARVECPGGGPPRFTGFVRDISDRRQAADTSASLRVVLQELLVARDIQEGVLPKRVPRLPGVEVAGMVRAAAQCSGDFYDFLTIPGGGVAVGLGDASGHGVGPALVASETATCLRTLARTCGRVDHLLTEANAVMCDVTPPAAFLTMILVGLDPAGRSLTYANAGHPSGLVIGADRRVRAELASTDLPLAVSPDTMYEQGGPVPLESGDLVVLVSDGLLEAWAPDGVAFGRERLREAACALQPEPPGVVVERLYEAVRAFTHWAPQHDDMSAVAIKVSSE